MMRRTTLGPISSSRLNTQPAGAGQSTARMSFGPSKTVGRQSIGPLGGGASSRRVSTSTRGARPPAPSRPRGSISRQSIGSAGAQGRRSSVYSGRASVSGRSATRMTEPRPLNDKSFMMSSIQNLIEFLTERQYDQALSLKQLLRGPSKKDFGNIVQFLFRQIDPSFELGPKIEEDVAAQFRIMRYPFAVSKTALVAAGSPHSWPALLGCISWLVELLTYDELVQQGGHEDEEDTENGDKAFFEYLGSAYQVFLAGDDDQYNFLEKEEAKKHESKNQLIREETSRLEQEREELKQRIQAAKNAKESLPAYRKQKADCISDLEKFKVYVSRLQMQKTTFRDKIQHRVEIREEKEKALQELKKVSDGIRERIAQQELSADDIDQMTKEAARLKEQNQQVLDRQKDVQNNVYQDETHIAEQMDNLERLIQTYTETATKLKLVPRMAKNAFGIDYEIEIDAHTGGVEAAQQLSAYLKQHIRPAVQNFKKNRIDRRTLGLDEVLELKADAQKSRESLSVEKQAHQSWESQTKKLDEYLRRERKTQEAAISRKLHTAEEIEGQIESILNERDTAVEQTQSTEKYEEAKKIYTSVVASYSSAIERNRHQVANVLVTCTDHKEMMEQAIASLEAELESAQQSG